MTLSNSNQIPLTAVEADRFQRHFSVWETGLQHHPGVPFAAYDPGMWANVRLFFVGGRSIGVPNVDCVLVEPLSLILERRSDSGMAMEFASGSQSVQMEFLNEPREGLFPNQVRVSLNGRQVSVENIAGEAANSVLSDILLGRALLQGVPQNYFCNGNQWLAGVESVDSGGALRFVLQDGREFKTSREGGRFIGTGGVHLDSLPREEVGSLNPYRSLPNWPLD